MFVAVEAFADSEPGIEQHDDMALLRKFGEYVQVLGTQPVTVTISSLVNDMLDSYASVTRGMEEFSWKQNLASIVEEFISTRECFLFTPNRAPVLEATFNVMKFGVDELDVGLHFTWNPPFVDFHNLRNVIHEAERFCLTPVFYSRPSNSLPITAEYFLEFEDSWLEWDEKEEHFHGFIPRRIASDVGAERFESYTVPLHLTARITKHFPGTMRFERLFRCAIPLTVKRQPSSCACYEEKAATPPIPRPTGSRKTSGKNTPLVQAPLMRSPLKLANTRSSLASSRSQSRRDLGKENGSLSTETVSKLLDRKAQYGELRPPSPISLDSLSLARLHDGIALAHPPPGLVNVEVRTVLGIEDKENSGPYTPGRSRYRKPSSSVRRGMPVNARETENCEILGVVDLRQSPTKLDLGTTHINRHGKLASRSESDEEDRDPGVQTPPTRNIAPPLVNARPSASQRRKGKQPLRDTDSPTKPGKFHKSTDTTPQGPDVCYVCAAEGRESRTMTDDTGVKTCLTCQQASVYHWMDDVDKQRTPENERNIWRDLHANCAFYADHPRSRRVARLSPVRVSSRQTELTSSIKPESSASRLNEQLIVDDWQADIQSNYNEFVAAKGGVVNEKSDVTMLDVMESDEDLLSFQSDL